MTYQRKCENWLLTFRDWTYNRSEAPESFILWAGLYALAASLRRQVKVGKEYLGSWECTPHLYVMFVGPPGGPRKTTTIEYACELLEKLTKVTKGPDIVSQAALLTKLIESEDSSVYITSHEFSDLIMKSGPEMYAFLTSMFDGKRSIEASTISRGVEFATKPCVNMFAATTPVWVSANMGEDIIGGGFASRVIFIYEDKARQRRFFHNKGDHNSESDYDVKVAEKLAKYLAEDLAHISTLHGDFKLTDEATQFLEEWYQTEVDKPRNKNVQGYFNRKHTHLLKVCMLVHVAYSDELVINITDARMALDIINSIEKRLPEVFKGIGKNKHIFTMHDILDYVKLRGSVLREQMLLDFESADEPDKLMRLVESLIIVKRLKVVEKEKHFYYEIP